MKSFLKGFIYALRGIFHCIRHERNFRIHLFIAVFVVMLSPYFTHSRAELAVLVITVTLVLFAEIINTALENVVDMYSKSKNKLACVVKDVSAGAVLLCALGSVGTACILFSRTDDWKLLCRDFGDNPLKIALFAVLFVLGVLFVVFGGKKIVISEDI